VVCAAGGLPAQHAQLQLQAADAALGGFQRRRRAVLADGDAAHAVSSTEIALSGSRRPGM
jgi:hypothetical protein